MIVEELAARLGFRLSGQSEARKFIKLMEDCRKASKGASGAMRSGFTGNTSGLGRVTKDFDRAAAAARRFRIEAERAGRARPAGGFGGGGGNSFYSRRQNPSRGGHGGSHGGGGGGITPFIAGVGAGPMAAAAGAYLVGRAVQKTTKDAMNFERSMIVVGKATDTAGTALEERGLQLQQLARDTGKGQNDLAELMSAAGFAGRPQDELMRFTEYGAKAAVAWQTSTEETGQALAEIGNIYGANQSRIEEIGDAINKAADSSASKETHLLDFMRRAGASAKEAGLKAEQILPFAAAMKEVGVRTDVAATGFEALLNVMKLGDKFSKSAGEGLSMLGVNSTKMRKQFAAKPLETMLDLLEKIQKVSDPLKKAEIMTNLFGKEYQDDIAKMLNGMPKIRQYLQMLNDPKNYKGDVRKQFEEQLKFDVSKIDRASAAIETMTTRLGNLNKIMLGFAAEGFNKAFDHIVKGLDQVSENPDTSDAKLREINGLPPIITADQFNDRFGKGTSSVPLERYSMRHRTKNGLPAFTRLPGSKKYAMDYQKAPEDYYPPTLGGGVAGSSFGIGGPKGTAWMQQSMQQATSNITNNSNVGNDQRTMSVSIAQTVNGVAGVASAAAEGARSALSGMGPSIAKAFPNPTVTLP